jgi:hypothetical protein
VGEKTDSTCPAHRGLACDDGPIAAFMISKVIRDQWHMFLCKCVL